MTALGGGLSAAPVTTFTSIDVMIRILEAPLRSCFQSTRCLDGVTRTALALFAECVVRGSGKVLESTIDPGEVEVSLLTGFGVRGERRN